MTWKRAVSLHSAFNANFQPAHQPGGDLHCHRLIAGRLLHRSKSCPAPGRGPRSPWRREALRPPPSWPRTPDETGHAGRSAPSPEPAPLAADRSASSPNAATSPSRSAQKLTGSTATWPRYCARRPPPGRARRRASSTQRSLPPPCKGSGPQCALVRAVPLPAKLCRTLSQGQAAGRQTATGRGERLGRRCRRRSWG